MVPSNKQTKKQIDTIHPRVINACWEILQFFSMIVLIEIAHLQRISHCHIPHQMDKNSKSLILSLNKKHCESLTSAPQKKAGECTVYHSKKLKYQSNQSGHPSIWFHL